MTHYRGPATGAGAREIVVGRVVAFRECIRRLEEELRTAEEVELTCLEGLPDPSQCFILFLRQHQFFSNLQAETAGEYIPGLRASLAVSGVE